jgi:HK97 family phage major capsid protein
MPDTAGQAEIRGIDIVKLVEGFANVDVILRKYVRTLPTSNREIRYYAKTAGFLTSPTTTAVTTDMIETSSKSRPVVIENSYTRATTYVKKFFASSPLISLEDLKDSDPDVWGDIIQDAARAVNKKIDSHIYSVLVAGGAQTTAATADGWNVANTADPIADLINARNAIKNYGYDTSNAVVYMNNAEEKWLLSWLISTKGSSIPNFSSDKVSTGKIMELLGMSIVVDPNCPTDNVVVFIPERSVIYKEFMPLSSAIVSDEGIGKTVRVWAEGVAYRPNPYSVFVISDTIN